MMGIYYLELFNILRKKKDLNGDLEEILKIHRRNLTVDENENIIITKKIN